MGSADIIPGVSGGTIALITGIYAQLIDAIRSFNMVVVAKLLRLQWKSAVAQVHLRFLACLLAGIATALVTLARVIHLGLDHYPIQINSFFFGLITASIWVVGKKIPQWGFLVWGAFTLGTLLALLIVNLIPVTTPESAWFIFLCGAIAVCAMILPGISGAFILLILGKYSYVTGALKNPFDLMNLFIIVVFCLGCATGLMGFARILSHMLNRYFGLTLGFLTGLMTGSMWKIWPWKQVAQSMTIKGKTMVTKAHNIWPSDLGPETLMAIGLGLLGILVVLGLEKLGQQKTSRHASSASA
jgi:putative membrane protein